MDLQVIYNISHLIHMGSLNIQIDIMFYIGSLNWIQIGTFQGRNKIAIIIENIRTKSSSCVQQLNLLALI